MDCQLEIRGSEASDGRQCEHGGRKGYPLRVEKADTLPRSPLPSPHTGWWVERSFAVCSPDSPLSGCHEWMSQRCWTPGSAVTYCRTSSGGPAWPHRCRKWLATVNDASNMKVLEPKHQCRPSLPLLPWSCYTWISQVLRWLQSKTNQHTWWVFWSSVITLQNRSWLTWLPSKLQRLLLSF